MLTSPGILLKASPLSSPVRIAILLSVLAVFPASAETGVLVEAPRRIVGIELFPTLVVPYHRARYERAGVDLFVYYTEAGLPMPEDASTVQCGTRILRVLADPDLQVRVLEHDGETLIFAWDTDDAVDLCRFLPSFLDDFDFFRDALPGDRGSWLPATIE